VFLVVSLFETAFKCVRLVGLTANFVLGLSCEYCHDLIFIREFV
jgi:hypothetical protein